MKLNTLEEITLKKSTKTKQDNGVYINTYTLVDNYKVNKQELNDVISSSIYGASVNNMYRITSPLNELENYLKTKLNNTEDNLSYYFIFINEVQYKINSVRKKWVDIERI